MPNTYTMKVRIQDNQPPRKDKVKVKGPEEVAGELHGSLCGAKPGDVVVWKKDTPGVPNFKLKFTDGSDEGMVPLTPVLPYKWLPGNAGVTDFVGEWHGTIKPGVDMTKYTVSVRPALDIKPFDPTIIVSPDNIFPVSLLIAVLVGLVAGAALGFIGARLMSRRAA